MPKLNSHSFALAAAALACLTSTPPSMASDVPDPIAARGETLVAAVHATGVQVYECKTDTSGGLAWQFREPIATLFAAGQTVGRHYAGPHWEMADGSAVSARVSARAPGASENDIPLLKLEVASWRGTGQLAGVTTIQRLNTKGGVAEGSCNTAGEILSVPYTADYTFYRRTAAAVSAPVSSATPAARAVAPRYIASPVAVPPPAIGVIIVRSDERSRRRKKKDDHGGQPKSQPTQPTPPTAEPKSPPIVPNRTVRDHRGTNGSGPTVTPTRPTYDGAEKAERSGPSEKRQPKMRDHRGVDAAARGGASGTRQPKIRDHRSATTPPKTGNPPRGSASSGSGGVNCGTQGNPRCVQQ